MSVCLSVHMQKLVSNWTDFRKSFYLSIFRKFVEKIRVSFKSDKNYGYFKCILMHVYDNRCMIAGV